MLYVALSELAVLALVVSSFLSVLRSSKRAHDRREDQLLNQLLHAVGRPWEPAPSDSFTPEPAPLYDDDGELVLSDRYFRFTTSPEQEP